MMKSIKYVLILISMATASLAIEPSKSSSADLAPGAPRKAAPPVMAGNGPMPAITPAPMRNVPGVTPDANFKPDPQFSAWPHIDLEEAKRLQKKKGVLFVDARAEVEWAQAHIPGAIPLPTGADFEKYYSKYKKRLKAAKVIVSYCHGAGCHLSDKVCQQLEGKGFKNMVGFFGGAPKWHEAGLPEEDKNGKRVTAPKPAAH